MDTEQVEVKGISDEDGIYADSEEGCELARVTISSEPQRAEESTPAENTSNSCPAWLVDVWRHYKKKAEFALMSGDWVQKYPDLAELIRQSRERGEIDVFPSRAEQAGLPAFYDIITKPDTVRALEQSQITRAEDVKRQDPRNRKGALLTYGNIHGLAIDARSWLRNLNDPFSKKVNASERMLQDLVGLRYAELNAEYPNLLRDIECALTRPMKNPVCV